MPHIIVEHSESLTPIIPKLLVKLHEALGAEGVVKSQIKTRAISCAHTIVGEQVGANMLHTTLLLWAGRDVATKQRYGQALHYVMKAAVPEACAVTLEIRDMDEETYFS